MKKLLVGAGSFAICGYKYYCASNPSQPVSDSAPNYASSSVLFKSRKQHLEEVASNPSYDIVVVGGGASGAGVLLDAASRGYKCLLIQADDFASGASSKSTKLLHGGVRYLEQVFMSRDGLSARIQKYKLVKEALQERSCLIQNAPYMNGKLPFVIPCSSLWQQLYYYAGCVVYHLIYVMNKQSGDIDFTFPYFMKRSQLRRDYPYISDRYQSGIIYEDGQFNDARLNLSVLLTATTQQSEQTKINPANILNKAKLVQLVKKDGKISGVVFEDRLSGKQYTVDARYVVNCTGAFADRIRQMDDPTKKNRILCVAGSHLTFDSKLAKGQMALTIPSSDGRVLLIVPWLGKIIAGTTEQKLEAPTNNPTITVEEKQFILGEMGNIFDKMPKAMLLDINLSSWTGVRPLVLQENATDTKSVARSHVIERSENGLYSLMGGKWTVYRKMGEELVDQIEKQESKLDPARKFRKSVTKKLRLVGARYSQDYQDQLVSRFGPETGKHLFTSYGGLAEAILALSKNNILEYVDLETGISAQELQYIIRNQMPTTIQDVLLRRTRVAFLNSQKVEPLAKLTAKIMAKQLGWSDAKLIQEFSKFMQSYNNLMFN